MTTWLAILFWAAALIVFYTHIGYGLVLWGLVRLRRRSGASPAPAPSPLPAVTVIVPAYNEAAIIGEKAANTLGLDYPPALLEVLFVTDGSTDGTPAVLQALPLPPGRSVRIEHSPERRGKLAAVDRIMPQVHTPITVFTDANTMLNREALQRLVAPYADPAIGAVSGEKRVQSAAGSGVEGQGEGAYWRYESTLKRLDAELYSIVGAAGELFSIRTTLYESAPPDTVLDDFYWSLRIAMRGLRVAYAPDAYALEGPAASLGEEFKRKVRNAAGGIQAIVRLPGLLNPARYGILSFQYISHRVLRWTLAPLLLPVLLGLNLALALDGPPVYAVLLALQLAFYAAALVGWVLDQLGVQVGKVLYIPMYFCMMNAAVYVGALRLVRGAQSAAWEKTRRA